MKEDSINKYISLSNVSPGLLKKISELLESCFTQKDKTLEEKAEHNDKYCSKKDRIGFFLAIKENQIIGVVIVLKRKIIYHGEHIIRGHWRSLC